MGGILGASLMWLNTSKRGREVRDDILDRSAEVYAQVKERVLASGALERMKKNEYVKVVKETVDRYAKEHKIVGTTRRLIEKIVASQWKDLQKGKKKK